MTHPARKKWGQNFLTDPNICRKIVGLLDLNDGEAVIEIGPGLGALTRELSKQNVELTGIEIDALCCEHLEKFKLPNLEIVNKDFLNYDLNKFDKPFKIIGNLPYYITTPIMFKVIKNRHWKKAVFMAQKEVVDRIAAFPGSKTYGRLTVMSNLFCQIKKEISVPSHVFKPVPQVDSTVFSLTPKPVPKLILAHVEEFENFIRGAFSQRRKVLRNSLKKYITPKTDELYGSLRPEQLSLDEFKNIFTVWKNCVD